ncbi:MAG TPA: hypothetical protein VJT33_14740 [bacterium]|nr:hypothetical protein [bacterium]
MGKPLSWLALLVAVFVALQLFSIAGLVLLNRLKHITYGPVAIDSITKQQRLMLEEFLAGKAGHVAYSSVLGWTANPNGRAPLYRANSAEPRAGRGYALHPRGGALRIATFGSFYYGDDVKEEDSWQEVMMRMRPNIEVLNFGVQDFGIDQALLRYEHDGAAYRPDIVLMEFFPESIYLSVNTYRPFYYRDTDLPLAKPRYVLQSGRLLLLPTPLAVLPQYSALATNPARVLPMLGQHDYYYQSQYHRGSLAVLPSVRLLQILRRQLVYQGTAIGIEENGVYNVDSEAFKVTAAIFDEFVDAARRAGSVPIIVALPHAADIDRFRRDGQKRYAPLLARFQTRGYRYVDMLEGFEEYGKRMAAAELAPGEYSPLGNQIVAKVVWQFLVTHGLTNNRRPH